MRIGLDIDGVLANFTKSYEDIIIEVTGVDNFQNRRGFTPSEWSWEKSFGYTSEQIGKVWAVIKDAPEFWDRLTPLPGLLDALRISLRHDVYFITDRPGIGARRITQEWLIQKGFHCPNVIISRNGKGAVCDALDLEVYADDKVENVLDVQRKAPKCRAYLAPSYPYNANHPDVRKVHLGDADLVSVLKREHIL